MRKAGARLTFAGAMGRPGQFDVDGETNSASLAQAEREIKQLKLENHKLKKELADIRSLYNQLVKENSHERYDERRVVLLKSQVIQLERQILLQNEALSSRGAVLLEVENALKWLADKCRCYITMDVRGPQVNVERSDLTLMVETTESARIKLYKQLENRTTEQLARPLKFFNDFVHPQREGDITLLDVAAGKIEHLNLKQVSKLEGKLSTLYKELIGLHSLMDEESNNPYQIWTSGHVTQAVRERLTTQILKSCAIMKDCTDDLLELSLLFPSAPWPPLKTSALKKITPDYVLKCLPLPTRSKQGDTSKCIQALVKAYNYKVFMLKNEIDTLKGEVKYHKNVYNLQLKYTESLFQVVREGYTDFEKMGNEVIVKPLKDILDAYIVLNQSASEQSLKKFISVFRQHAAQLSDVVETLGLKDFEESEGSRVLSQYGDEFFIALEKVVQEQQAKRDMEAVKSNDIKTEQEKLDSELREILDEQEQRLQQKLIDTSNMSGDPDDTTSSHFDESQDKNRSARGDVSIITDRSIIGRHESPVQTSRSSINDNVNAAVSKKTKKKSENKPLHMKEWVSIFDVDESLEELDIDKDAPTDKDTSNELTDLELLAMNRQKDRETQNYLIPNNPFSNSTNNPIGPVGVQSNESEMKSNEIAKTKPKKKLNYTPNTFVPNRTLNLRRSGSASRLSKEPSTNPVPGCQSYGDTEVAMETVKNPPSAKTRTNQTYKDIPASKLPQKRPAFK